MTANADALTRAVTDEAARALGVAPSRVNVADISSRFPWSTRHRVFSALDASVRAGRKITLVASPASRAVLRAGEAAEAAPLDALNAMLAAEELALPGALPPVALAEAIRLIGGAPSGLVGSRALLARETATPAKGGPPPIDFWCKSDPSLRELFEAHAIDPVLVDGPSGFELRFSVFTLQGAVESWVARGDARRIESATPTIVAPQRTLRPPIA